MMRQMKKNMSGFTLLELSIVMLVISVVFAGIWTAASRVRQQGKVNDAVIMVSEIARNVDGVYTGFSAAVVPTVAQQIARGMFPESALNSAGTNTLNVWGGRYEINFLRISSRNRGYFVELTFPASMDVDLSQKICAQIASRFVPTGENEGTRSGISSDLPTRNEAQGNSPTNLLMNDIDMTGLDPATMIATLGSTRCNKLSFYYPL